VRVPPTTPPAPAVACTSPTPAAARSTRSPLGRGCASDPARGRLWVTETGSNRLVELDVSAPRPRIVATFPTVRQPNTVAVDPTTGDVYVAGADAGVVEVLHP
jgi:DNA-binding beta-propeller fold protein YncE